MASAVTQMYVDQQIPDTYKPDIFWVNSEVLQRQKKKKEKKKEA